MKKRSFSLLVTLASALILAQNPAFADKTLEEIIVTAQKRSENLQDVPIAVSALANTELSAANIEGQFTLPKLVPNMHFTRIASFGSVYLRGVGTQYANPGLESSVPVYFDDTYIPRANSAMFTFTDIERIEVLKGPQGTLYGRNATGGAIRIITPDPKDEFELSLAATAGTDDRRAYDGMINIPITDRLAIRLAGRHDENDGFVTNLYRPTLSPKTDDRDEDMVLAKILYEPTDKLTIKLSGDWAEKKDSEGHSFINLRKAPEQIGLALGGCGSTSFYTMCNDQSQSSVPRKIGMNVKSWGSTLRFDYDLGGSTASSITALRSTHENNTADLDSTGADIQNGAGRPRTRQFTQEFQITSDSEGPVNYVAGLYYLKETSGYYFSVYGGGLDAALGFPGASLGGDGEVDIESIAPYAQLDVNFLDDFTLTAGLRFTKEEKDLNYNSVVIGPVAQDGFVNEEFAVRLPVPHVSESFKEFTPKLTLSWQATDELMLYGTYARGFKSGGLNLPAFGPVDTVNPEILDEVELGWKMETDTIRFNGAGFYYNYKDLQIQITDQETGGTKVTNAAQAVVWGIEGDLTWAPTNQLELGTGLGVQKAEYKDFIGDAYVACADVPNLAENTASEILGKQVAEATCAANFGLGTPLVSGQDLSGNDLVNTPKITGYLRGQYTFQLDEMGSLTFGAIANYHDKSYFDVGNDFEDESRWMLSANITWLSANDKYSLTVYGENLTDEEYNTINQPQGDGGWRVPGPPRQIYVKAKVNF